MLTNLPSINILGTNVTVANREQLLDFVVKGIEEKKEKFYIVTPNPEILMRATRSSSFQKVLNGAKVSLPDGIGVLAAGNILKNTKIERMTGTDFMLELCKECARKGLSIGLLGGKGNVAEKTADCLREKYPDLIVKLASETWPSDSYKVSSIKYQAKEGIHNTKYLTPNTHIDLLFVAFGAPKQEEWIASNLPDIDVTCSMGVGGAFDFISGKVPRAPKVLRALGMEWAFRLAIQPWRIKRQLVLPVFVWKVIKEKLN